MFAAVLLWILASCVLVKNVWQCLKDLLFALQKNTAKRGDTIAHSGRMSRKAGIGKRKC